MEILNTELGPIKIKWIGEAKTSVLPIVYIGGAFQTVQAMERMFKDVARFTRMLLIEAPGYSDVPLSHEVPFTAIAEEVTTQLYKMNLGRFNLMGGSYGGLIAIYVSQSYRLNINSLILCGFGYFSKLTRFGLSKSVELIENGNIKEGVGLFRSLVLNHEQKEKITKFNDIEKRVTLMLESMSLMQVKCYAENTKRLLNISEQSLPVPSCNTLLFTGELDRFTPPEGMKEFAGRCPNASVKLIPNADHFFHVQNRKKSSEYIINFFGIDVLSEAVA